jgi:hypothetical protein
MNLNEKQLKAIQWAITESQRQLILAEKALSHNPKYEPYQRDVENFKNVHEGLQEILSMFK